MNAALTDNYGRQFRYLRLSVTDVCNFRCQYCLPDGYQGNNRQFLSLNEIKLLIQAFSALGLEKIRITGGEPTLRKDHLDIIKLAANFPNLKTIALTSNGYKLEKQIHDLHHAGLNAINISIDSLDAPTFKTLTGHDKLPSILRAINTALTLNFNKVHINVVLMRDVNHHKLNDFIHFVEDKNISIRFIELMRTGNNIEHFEKHHVSATVISQQLMAQGWQALPRAPLAGPAIEYTHPNYHGHIGIIAPYSKDFCQTCNRLRVSAQGNLQLCLFAELGYSLRHLLQSESQQSLLIQFIKNKLAFKQASHALAENKTGLTDNFSLIGG